jgi:hypothetical protein
MSRWVRGIYNSAANFVLSRSLRAASGRTMGRNSKHLPEEPNKSDQHDKSCESSKSNSTTSTSCSRAACSCARASYRSGSRATCSCSSSDERKCAINSANPNDECSCSACRSYADYLATTDAKGQGIGSRVRDSVEPRNFKQADADSRDSIERCTGIPAGVTV